MAALDLFGDADRLAALLAANLPVCRGGAAQLFACRVHEVITGRRGKVFALADVDVVYADGEPASRRLVLQQFPDSAQSVEEGRKVFRRLRRTARERGLRSVLLPWRAFVREERLLAVPFPFDYRLHTLVDACDAGAVTERLSALEGAPVAVRAVTPVRYVPEKRCQIRYDVESADGSMSSVYGKVMAEESGARLVDWMHALQRAFARDGVAGTPAPVGYLAEWRMLLQRAVPGRTIYELQRESALTAGVYERIGAALHLLHDTAVPDLPIHGPVEELALLDGMLRKQVLPEATQAEAESLLARLRIADACLGPQESATAHRDFYDKQLLYGPGGLWVIDLDTLARAPRALDAGNFLAHVQLRRRQGYLSMAAALQARAGFLAGYDSDRHLDGDALHWWTAASLLRLSVIYAVRPAWRHLATPLVDDARAALAFTGLVAVPSPAVRRVGGRS